MPLAALKYARLCTPDRTPSEGTIRAEGQRRSRHAYPLLNGGTIGAQVFLPGGAHVTHTPEKLLRASDYAGARAAPRVRQSGGSATSALGTGGLCARGLWGRGRPLSTILSLSQIALHRRRGQGTGAESPALKHQDPHPLDGLGRAAEGTAASFTPGPSARDRCILLRGGATRRLLCGQGVSKPEAPVASPNQGHTGPPSRPLRAQTEQDERMLNDHHMYVDKT